MFPSISRRQLLKCGALSGAALLTQRAALAQQSSEAKPETVTYKTVGPLAIKADVYPARDKAARPAVVWFHGGALIMGDKSGINKRVKQHAFDAGYVLISLDYRLAPETQLPEIIQDLEDAFAWIGREGARRFNIDPARIAVAGESAGGYLTLTSGFRARPRPAALLSLYGYGDLIGDWYSTPSPHPRHHGSKMSRDEAYRQVSGAAIADSRDRKGDGGAFYQYCRQTGSWPKAVSGWDPIKEPEKFYPYMAVKNVTAEYPPTTMIHGTEDTDVPYEESAMMARELERVGVPHQLIDIPGGEHGLRGGDPGVIDAAYAQAFAFVDERLRTK